MVQPTRDLVFQIFINVSKPENILSCEVAETPRHEDVGSNPVQLLAAVEQSWDQSCLKIQSGFIHLKFRKSVLKDYFFTKTRGRFF